MHVHELIPCVRRRGPSSHGYIHHIIRFLLFKISLAALTGKARSQGVMGIAALRAPTT